MPMVPLPGPSTDDNSTADLTAVIRDRRKQVWFRRLRILGVVLAILALLAVAWFSPLLGLQKAAVSGSRLVDHEEVSAFVLSRHARTPLPQIRTGAVETEVLEQFPKAEAVSVHYQGPRSLRLEITDRTPVIAITTAAGFELFDAEAVNLGAVDEAPAGLTVLEDSKGPPDEQTVTAVIRFMAELRPELRANLESIAATDPSRLQGKISTGESEAEVVFGDSEAASLKMRTAVQLAEAGRTSIDVSVPSVPVTN